MIMVILRFILLFCVLLIRLVRWTVFLIRRCRQVWHRSLIVKCIIRNSLILLGISTFWQGTFVGSFIVIAVAFDRFRQARSSE